jgi:hypothetical protein
VPGWTARGYPNLSGYAWYRLRLLVTDPAQPLMLKMPLDVDDAYQVYANGRYIGQLGRFSPRHVALYASRTLSFPLPAPGPDEGVDLAVRFYLSAATASSTSNAGGMHEAPVLGLASTVHLLQTASENADQRLWFGALLQALLSLLLAPLALWAWLRNRRERIYLWLFLALVCVILLALVGALTNLSFVFAAAAQPFLNSILLLPLPVTIMFWWHWFGLQDKRWMPLAAWLLAAARILADFFAESPYLGLSFVSQPALHWFNLAAVWCAAALGVLLLVILVEGFRRDRTEALLALVPILLLEFAGVQSALLATFHIPWMLFAFGLGVSVGSIAAILMILVIATLALRRFVRTQVQQEVAREAIAQDLEQAQQLQQRVLVPEMLHSPFFSIETEYRPAQTVGGDFFQMLTRPDGGLLVVIGDVSGKGVSAAMLVAVLVGAIRNQADYSFDSVSMLTMLNRRLLGRSGGHFATCLAAQILPDGKMNIANAGHLPPYLNGKEMEIEGSLPLGLSSEAVPAAETLTLEPGDLLTFLTDGVVEAMNAASELFGFERAQQISRQPAASIAQQAQSFGQNDDITVLRVEFTGTMAD